VARREVAGRTGAGAGPLEGGSGVRDPLRQPQPPSPPLGKFIENVERGEKDNKFFLKLSRAMTHVASVPPGMNGILSETGDFAVEVAGSVSGPKAQWGLSLGNAAGSVNPYHVNLILCNTGQLVIESVVGNGASETLLPPTAHPKIKTGDNQVNRLLAVVRRGRTLEVYVNGSTVCQPLVLKREVNTLALGVLARSAEPKGCVVEVVSVVGWASERLSTPEARGAVRPQ
jgi:hypothetical protein